MSTPAAPDPEQVKQTLRQEWNDAAEAWRRWNPQYVVQTRAATQLIVEAARVGPGMRVLDLASGSGEPALSLAEAVAPSGHVTATDLAPAMLAVAEEAARQRGLKTISFQPADPESLPFPEGGFDLVTSRWGVMFFPNVVQALREARRVLEPGGRVVLLAWGPFDQNPYFINTVGMFMKYVQLPPPPPDAPQPFKFAEAGTLSAALQTAGFRQVQEEYRAISLRWPGPAEQLWEARRAQGAPAWRRFTEALEPERRDQVVGEVIAALKQYDNGQQVDIPAVTVLATAAR